MEAPLVADRPDPIDLLLDQEQDRLDWLLPVRHSRMAVSAFTFYRGAAAVMAADLARQPHSGVMVQLCGDAHLLNFGFYGTPERQLLFDLNDFDETHPGPFEWDVQRLAASMVLAARDLNLSVKQQEKVCRRTVRAYAKAMAGWTTNRAGYQDYWRQFRDWKLSVDVSVLDAEGLTDYGRLFAWTLAKAHARSGDRGAICNAIGSSKAFAATVLEQAVVHADQAQLDYQLLLTRIASGEISTSTVH